MVGSTPTRFRHIHLRRRQLQKSEAAKGGIKGKSPVFRVGFFSRTSDNRSAECEFKAAFNQARAKSNPAVTEQLEQEYQALTGSAKEPKVLKTRRRELLLFLDCSRDLSVGFRNQISGRIGSDAQRVESLRRCKQAGTVAFDSGNHVPLALGQPGACFKQPNLDFLSIGFGQKEDIQLGDTSREAESTPSSTHSRPGCE